MIASSIASRSAHLCFATFTVDLHPFIGVDEQGIKIMQHFGRCDRNGSSRLISDIDLAYVSRHAIGRLHEREHNLTSDGTTGGLACVGVLGYLTRNSAKHVAGELCLHIGDVLVVGSLKHTMKPLAMAARSMARSTTCAPCCRPMRSTIGKCAIRAALLVMWSPRGSPIRRTMTAHSPTKFRSCRAAPTTTRFARRW